MSIQPVQPAEAVGSPRGITLYPGRAVAQRFEEPPAANTSSRGGSSSSAREVPTSSQLRCAYAEFVVDPDTSRVQVRIVDATTKQLIRAIPADEVEQLARSLREYSDAAALRRTAARRAASPDL